MKGNRKGNITDAPSVSQARAAWIPGGTPLSKNQLKYAAQNSLNDNEPLLSPVASHQEFQMIKMEKRKRSGKIKPRSLSNVSKPKKTIEWGK
jgi:hypothetical protein